MKRSSKRLQILLAVTLLLYACGYLTQFIGNYAVWQKNGGMPGGTSPPFPSLSPPDCLKGILWFPYKYEVSSKGIYGITTLFRWLPYSAFMLFGAWMGVKRKELRFNAKYDFILMIFCFPLPRIS